MLLESIWDTMSGSISHQTDAENLRVTITLTKLAYEQVKSISGRMGLKPSTWISMLVTSRVNDLELVIRDKGQGELPVEKPGRDS